MANVWMTRDEMIADSSLLPAEFNAQYLDGNGAMVDCVYTKNDVLQNRVGVSDTTCDMTWWQEGDNGTNNRFIAQYLATNITNLPQSAADRRVSIDIPVYMKNVKYLDICFCVWVDLGYARGLSLSAFNNVSYANYVKDKHLLKLYCIPTPGKDHPGTGRLSIQGSPGFVPFRFLYDDEENPINIDFISLQFSGAYSEQNVFNVWISQPCYNDDIEYDEKPQPIPQEGNFGPVTENKGGEGSFVAQSDIIFNFGDLVNYFETASNNVTSALNAASIKIYDPSANKLPAILASTFSEKFVLDEKFQNYMFNPISCILSVHMLPSMLVAGVNAQNVDVTAAGMKFKSGMTNLTSDTVKAISYGKFELTFTDFPEYFGPNGKYYDSFADFAPYTTVKLHLPFAGDVTLDTNSLIWGGIEINWACDNTNGNIGYTILCKDRYGTITTQSITGNAAVTIPIAMQSQSPQGMVQAISGGVQAIVGGLTGNPAAVAGGLGNMGSGLVSQALTPNSTQTTGTLSGNVTQLMPRKMYLEITRPRWVETELYREQKGLPSTYSGNIADGGFLDFLSVTNVDLTNIVAATPEELAEIESMLKSGILIKE